MAAIHKMSHVQDFYAFHIGTDLAKMHFGQISTNMKCLGFYMGAPHHHDTSLQDNDGTTKAFSYPSGMCIVALEALHCVCGKKTGRFFLQLHREKPIFECMIGARPFVVFPSNEYNNVHPYLRQGLLVVLVPMIVYSAKRLVFLVQILARKVHFLT
jgi:hypothetical protein